MRALLGQFGHAKAACQQVGIDRARAFEEMVWRLGLLALGSPG
jgi:acyl-CoA synthetase (NDP forming)